MKVNADDISSFTATSSTTSSGTANLTAATGGGTINMSSAGGSSSYNLIGAGVDTLTGDGVILLRFRLRVKQIQIH